MDDTTALFEIANALAMLSGIGMTFLILLVSTIITVAAIKLESGFLYTLSSGALLLAAIYWLTQYQNVLGVGFSIIIAGGSAYAGYRAWEYYARRG